MAKQSYMYDIVNTNDRVLFLGIQIFEKLGMMMGYVDSNEGKVVLQKYIGESL